MKHLEDTPWWICDTEDTNYCAYMDTDSVYISAEPLLLYLHPDFESKSDKEKDNILGNVALEYQDVITRYYNTLAKDCFNVSEHKLVMKTECVIRSAYFRATRRYAQWITKQEGLDKETLDIKGLEFMKANFPPILGEFFNSILKQILKGETIDNILVQIKDFKEKILSGEIPITKLGNPTRVTKLDKYQNIKARAGEMFTPIEKGAPAPVRAAIKYNDLLRFWRLDKQHNYITAADKVKWCYLKNNPYKVEAIAYFDYDIPPKIEEFLNRFVDRQKIFDSILLNKLSGLFSDLGFELNLNPHKDAFDFFDV